MITEDKLLAMPGRMLRLRYSIRPDSGRAFLPDGPEDVLEIELGRTRLLPGFEKALLGMSAGETKTVRIPVGEAYGPRRPELKFRIKRPEQPALRVGDAVRVRGGANEEFFALVETIEESSVIVDANHPLSGQDLTFEIELLDVSLCPRVPGLVA